MDRRRTVIRVVWGSVAFALGIFQGTPAQPTPTIPANQYGMLAEPTRIQLREASRTERSVWNADLLEEEADLRDQLRELIGPPEPWPDTPEDELTPDAFAAWPLQGFEDILEVPPVWVDCDNYPCMASFALPEPEDEEVFLDTVRIRNDLYKQWGEDRVMWSSESGMHEDPDGNTWLLITISILPEEAPETLRQQVKVRTVFNRIAIRTLNDLSPVP